MDDESFDTAVANLADIEDPLARALVWGSAWDSTRDGEVAAERLRRPRARQHRDRERVDDDPALADPARAGRPHLRGAREAGCDHPPRGRRPVDAGAGGRGRIGRAVPVREVLREPGLDVGARRRARGAALRSDQPARASRSTPTSSWELLEGLVLVGAGRRGRDRRGARGRRHVERPAGRGAGARDDRDAGRQAGRDGCRAHRRHHPERDPAQHGSRLPARQRRRVARGARSGGTSTRSRRSGRTAATPSRATSCSSSTRDRSPRRGSSTPRTRGSTPTPTSRRCAGWSSRTSRASSARWPRRRGTRQAMAVPPCRPRLAGTPPTRHRRTRLTYGSEHMQESRMIEAVGLDQALRRARPPSTTSPSPCSPGEVTGFLGPNGAGKSTTMRMIVGLDRPTQRHA